jgi:hypothetical protein
VAEVEISLHRVYDWLININHASYLQSLGSAVSGTILRRLALIDSLCWSL